MKHDIIIKKKLTKNNNWDIGEFYLDTDFGQNDQS